METAFREQMKKRCDMMTELSVRLEKKLNKYANAGIIQGDRLFVTYETSAVPLDTRVIDRLIDEQFR